MNAEPIIITGISTNYPASQLVAFKFDGTWVQIPVQVDERVSIDISKPYNGFYGPTGYNIIVYADPNTYTGADTDINIDANDEIVFMDKDAGAKADSTYPAGVVDGTRKEVSINGTSFIYLFQNVGSLQQSAGVSYVSYDYPIANYLSSFVIGNSRNVENSSVITAKYKLNFIGEWILSGLFLNNTDILDRHKVFFADGYCQRTEDTFSDGQNCFITNKVGPIRAIRSIMGANSGQYTQRTYLFYEGRTDVITDLRVHEIQGIHDVFDYNPSANGMKYTNSLNSTPKIIDGIKEAIVKGDIQWELVTGNLGSLVILHRRSTTFQTGETLYSSYWDESKTKPASNCTGDGQAWGSSGPAIGFNNNLLYTEPAKGAYSYTSPNFRLLKNTRIIYYESPNIANDIAINYNSKQPAIVTVT